MTENTKKNNWMYWIATCFGLGYLPAVPGTWGTFGGIALYLLLIVISSSSLFYILAVLIAFIIGCWICEKVAQDMKVYDHGSVVWDEVVGYCISMFALPHTFFWITAGFILFRIFDIIKPWPIVLVDEKMKSGFGMMLDDVLAGIEVCFILHILHVFIR